MKTVHLRDIKCVNLEKQIFIEEQKVSKLAAETDRICRELNARGEKLQKLEELSAKTSLNNPQIINRANTAHSNSRSRLNRASSQRSETESPGVGSASRSKLRGLSQTSQGVSQFTGSSYGPAVNEKDLE